MTRASDTARTLSGGAAFNDGSNDVDFRVESNGDANMLFVDGGNDKVGIGTNSPNSKLTSQTATNSTSAFSFATQLNNSSGGVAQPNDGIVALGFHNRADVNATGAGVAIAMSGGGISAGSGNLIFCIKDTSGIGNVVAPSDEKIRIDSSGKLLVGTTSANGDGLSLMPRYSESSTTSQIRWNRANVSGTGSALVFQNNSSTVGSISHNNSATAYNTSSDYRLKENIVTDWDATTRLKQLKPCRFNFIVDADTTVDGFLAHEVSSVVPEAISGTKDATETYTDDDGKEQTRPSYQGIDQSKLVPLLVKTIQELEARIKALESA